MIRRSTKADYGIVKELLLSCFHIEWDTESPLDDLEGRYLLYFVDGVLVSMSGLGYSSEYKGLEIDWSCTLKEYRGMGYMRELFRLLLVDVRRDVYISCWRRTGKDKPNMYNVIRLFGFEEVIRGRVCWKTPYNCKPGVQCVCYGGEGCYCWEDLWLRRYVG